MACSRLFFIPTAISLLPEEKKLSGRLSVLYADLFIRLITLYNYVGHISTQPEVNALVNSK